MAPQQGAGFGAVRDHGVFTRRTPEATCARREDARQSSAWFLNGKDDVRSSYYLEDVATEFQVLGLELDWACVVWDADFRFAPEGWQHWSFRRNGWQRIRASERQVFQKNAYRVLLTRARQGMIVVVPPGDEEDPTRNPAYYDQTFEYLRSAGLSLI
jgi:hypothetical protein